MGVWSEAGRRLGFARVHPCSGCSGLVGESWCAFTLSLLVSPIWEGLETWASPPLTLIFPFYHLFSSRGTLLSPPLQFSLVFIRVTEILSNPAPKGDIMCQAPQLGWPSPWMASLAWNGVTQELQEWVLSSGESRRQILLPKDKMFHFWDNLSLLNPKHFLRHLYKIWWPISCQRGDFFICFSFPLRSPSLTSAATAEGGRNAFVFGLENDNFSRLF